MKRPKKISEIFRKIVIGYVFYTFPLTLIAFAIIPFPQSPVSDEFAMYWLEHIIFHNTLYSIAMAQCIIWLSVSFLYSLSMLFSRSNREIFIKKLSGIKERDEREVQIVGKALRASYLTTMTILLFFLFASCLFVVRSRKLDDNVEPGHPHGTLSVAIGFSYDPLEPDAIVTQKKGYESYFGCKGLPLSTPTVILILLVWQVVSFRVVSRRALKVP